MPVTPAEHAAHTNALADLVKSFLHPKPKIKITNTKVTFNQPNRSVLPAPTKAPFRNAMTPNQTKPIGIGVGP